MTLKEFTEIATVLAWPLTLIAFVAVFYKPVRALLERVTVKTIKLKVFGVEIELTPEQAKIAAAVLLQDIAQSTNQLSDKEMALFDSVVASAGRKTVVQLLPNFKRGNEDHKCLQELRDRMLIRPFETKSWQEVKHPVLTRFGQLVYDLRSARVTATS
jgi:hypothetical protein